MSQPPSTPDATMKGLPLSPSPARKMTATGHPTDEAVLAYLRQKGMGSAALELTNILKDDKAPSSKRVEMEMDDAVERNQRSILARTTGGGYGYDADSAPTIAQWGVPDSNARSSGEGSLADRMGKDEAKAYLDSFVALQLWVLSLPDVPSMVQPTANPVGKEPTGISIASIAQRPGQTVPEKIQKDAETLSSNKAMPWMPPSTKPELLGVTFALFVHTYCEILEVSMESTAEILLNTFRPVYEPLYSKELADLTKCTTTDCIVRLNTYNTAHVDSVKTLQAIMTQVANYQHRRDELKNDNSAAAKQRRAECDQNLTLLQQKYQEVSKRASTAFAKMKEFPFLRRARAVRWVLTLSASSYATLASFLSSQESLLPMSALLQTKCEVHVERRDPLPYTPSCVLDDNEQKDDDTKKDVEQVQWAAPVPPAARLAEAGGEAKASEQLPFPKFQLDKEYDTQENAEKDKRIVEFNRALLVNGFRRLEALERKREYELQGSDVEKMKKEARAMADPLKPTILQSTLCSTSSGPVLTNNTGRIGSADVSSIWQEPGVGITCAKMCPPDGRRVATGCDDAAIRIWSMYDQRDPDSVEPKSEKEISETAMVLLGHKNGFPVFDVDWNRDGRTLLSAGGDGSVRLWDTMAVGPYGATAKVSKRTSTNNAKQQPDHGATVPGLRPESSADISGAALAVYRGHSPLCPIWSVSFAPSGFYFATAASDATARIWTTDRPAPVRILAGHTSSSVNTVTWHPNCNYVLTGCDDKTVRMWDVQNGRCVRLLTGCNAGVNVVRVCPSGRYAAGADYSGLVHIWDLGSGKKVNELRPPTSKRDSTGAFRESSSMIHSLSYSACGTALATGGDDCVVRVWDVRGAANHMANPDYAAQQGWGEKGPVIRDDMTVSCQSFPTVRTSILDLQYTKRNLLLSLGKYLTPVPLAVTSPQ